MQDEVTDASDWPKAELREFERKLRCPICQDFYRAAMMLRGCSHNCTVHKLDCASSTTDLEVNRILDELVLDFVAVRPTLLAALVAPEATTSLSQSSQGSQERRKRNRKQLDANLIACPVCSKEVAADTIERHVDMCLSGAPASPSTSTIRRRMSKPVYNLLKDAEIKRLLTELSLPSTECDALKPKSMQQLRIELRNMERAWKKKPTVVDLGKDADFEQEASNYRKQNSEHFQLLIDSVRKKTGSNKPT
ncbi:hypothetical protein PSACC_03263 [Paramicrosporidium saccamoebae]|uniref:UBZ4-type domain-containing protein n=1 Tax=Paramicrosporidium saccamoebae TaxID=1246581 RepID=A0A2H9TGS0_9FUNG|nr:hypothetical protein PSACC_03263 [Paramicrosporidium saccamoebae]